MIPVLRLAPKWCFAVLAVAMPFVAAAEPISVTYGFYGITNNDPDDTAIGEQQLTVTVTDVGNGQVSFTFNNSGPAASSITDIYFDDGSLLGIAEISSGPGVSFSQGASPRNLSGGNNLETPFEATVGFLADSNPAVQPNGVNPGESVTILFDLKPGKIFADVTSELALGLSDPSALHNLRIGIHVQGFEGGGSESFVNSGPVPLPAVAPAAFGLLGMFGLKRGRRKAA